MDLFTLTEKAPTATGRNPVDPAALRRVAGRFVTGVTAITCRGNGRAVGVTVNSFTSVSLEPPMVLFCVHRRSRLRPALAAAGAFAVNILAADQAWLSRAFASGTASGFAGVRCHLGATGTPLLSDALAYLDCELTQTYDGGDHVIAVGTVVDLGVLREQDSPLAVFKSVAHRLIEDG